MGKTSDLSSRFQLSSRALSEITGLDSVQLDFVASHSFPIRDPNFVRTHIRRLSLASGLGTTKGVINTLSKTAVRTSRTLERVLSAKSNVSGLTILGLCVSLRVLFRELSSLDFAIPHEKPGPRSGTETLERVLRDRELRVLYVPMPPVWSSDGRFPGYAASWFNIALGCAGIKFVPLPCTDLYIIPTLLGGRVADVLVTSPENHPLRGELRYVYSLCRYKIGMIGIGSGPTNGALENLNSTLDGRVAVIPHGYSLFALQNWGVKKDYLCPGQYSTYEEMAEDIIGGEKDLAIAYHHGLKTALAQMPRHTKLVLAEQPVTICDYSIWVRQDDEALGSWLRDCLESHAHHLTEEVKQFRNLYRGSIDPCVRV